MSMTRQPLAKARVGIAVRHAARDLVGRQEAEPDQQLVAEIRVTTREQAPSGCNGGSHDLMNSKRRPGAS